MLPPQVPQNWPQCLEDASVREVRIAVLSRATNQVIDEKVWFAHKAHRVADI